MKKKALYIAFFVLISVWGDGLSDAYAQVAGDACTTEGELVARNISGTYTMLICDAAIYKEMIATTDGTFNIRFSNDTGTCTAAKNGKMRYDSVNKWWEFCDGAGNWRRM